MTRDEITALYYSHNPILKPFRPDLWNLKKNKKKTKKNKKKQTNTNNCYNSQIKKKSFITLEMLTRKIKDKEDHHKRRRVYLLSSRN